MGKARARFWTFAACRRKTGATKGKPMSDQIDSAQITLVTPPVFEPMDFAPVLDSVLAVAPVACVRLSLASTDARDLTRAADVLRETCHARDVAIVVDDHFRMVTAHGLDGVHLTSGARHVRDARKLLGPDAIVGAYCGASKHAGLTAAEIGTDYISFGPLVDTGALGDGEIADLELFRWWSEMIEVPLVAEGNATPIAVEKIKDYIDFLTLGPEIWNDEVGPVQGMEQILQNLKG